jgi:hypothetical protein
MAITLQTILATNSFSASRIIINNNFSAIKTSIDAVEGYLNTSTGALSATSGYIERGSNPTSTTLFTCEASGIFGGNLSIGGSTGLTTTALTVSNGVTVTGGDVLLSNSSRKLEVSGKFLVDSEVVFKDYGDGFLDAADEASFDPANVSVISAGVHKEAILSVVGIHGILLDFSTYDTVAGKIVKSFSLPTGNTVGQTLEIVVKTAAISGIYMEKTNIANLTGTQKVYFSNSPYDYQSVQLRWTGSTWIITNVLGATIS